MSPHNHNNNNNPTYLDNEDETTDYGYDRNTSYTIHSIPQHRHHEATNAKVATASGIEVPVKTKRSNTMSKVLWLVVVLVVLVVVGVLVWYYAFYKKNPSNEANDRIAGNEVGGSKGGANGDSGDGAAGQGTTSKFFLKMDNCGPEEDVVCHMLKFSWRKKGVLSVDSTSSIASHQLISPLIVLVVISPNGTVIQNDPHKLKRVFFGMAYVPLNAQLPNCHNTQETVGSELQLLVQATKRVRLYGTDCNALRYTIDTIVRLKLNLQVVVGIWIDKDPATYTRQTEELYAVVAKYGWSNIIGVSIGNEVIFGQVELLSIMISQINAVKSKVVQSGHPEIPVFTLDLKGANRPPLTNQEDLAGANLHPFFSGVPVDAAASWFWRYLHNTVSPAVQQGNLKLTPFWITEVGWPTFPATGNTSKSFYVHCLY